MYTKSDKLNEVASLSVFLYRPFATMDLATHVLLKKRRYDNGK